VLDPPQGDTTDDLPCSFPHSIICVPFDTITPELLKNATFLPRTSKYSGVFGWQGTSIFGFCVTDTIFS
jgi:hypothetical protein